MRITRLRADNFLRLKSVDIDLTQRDGMVEITGRNGAGKSALIQAIEATVGGAKRIPERPIRKGTKRAETSVEIDAPDGGLILTRGYTEGGGTSYRVTNALGANFKSPQAIVDALVDRLTIDPFAFLAMKPADQLETLRVQAGLDFSDLDAKRVKAFQDRTEINRQISRAEGHLANMPPREETAPAEPVNLSVLQAEYQAAVRHNGSLAELDARTQAAFGAYERAEERVTTTRDEIRRLEAELVRKKAAMDAAHADAREKLAAYEQAEQAAETAATTMVRLDPIEAQMRDAQAINSAVLANRDRAAQEDRVAALRAQAEDLTATIAAQDMEKAGRIAEVKLPIAGLDFGEDCVYWNGLPLAQASQSERLRVALAIAAEQAPGLKICRNTPPLQLDPR